MKPSLLVTVALNMCLTNARPSNSHHLAAQKETAKTVLDAYNAWDINLIMGFRAAECTHRVLPLSLGRKAQNNDEYRAYFSNFMPLFSNFTIVALEEIHDAAAHQSVIHATSTAETKVGPYANEYALILTFTEDGKKVTKFEEFVDSAYTKDFFAKLGSAQ